MTEPGITTAAPAPAEGRDAGARRTRLGDAPRRRRSGFGRSRLVSTLKYVLPGLAFLILVLAALWPRLSPDEDRFTIDLAAVGPEGGSKPQVLNPRLQGIDSERRPFQITADLGARAIGEDGEEIYDLTNPTADIVLKDGSWIALNANDGRFESATDILHLNGDVNLFHDEGYEFKTTSARVHLKDSSASGDEPVAGQGPFGILNAEGFRVLDSGARVLFIGPARLTVFEGAPPQ
ncbi:MAG: LPS export ABC transporter periplasmic protein LptC [Alphaproteobacteria bacterium]|nr:LPS export ABC transporter periplasmic protein LptC [Alphaproteobacteria bacterium]